MSTQESLFDRQTPAPKAVRDTSREAYREVLPEVKGRQLEVLRGLDSYLTYHDGEPTSSELMRYVGVTDPNSVRPRLTELLELRYAEASENPRKCGVTGKKAHTWRVTQRGEMFLRGQK